MAECIIARGGGRSDGGSSGPPIIVDKHTILVTLVDSNNIPVPNMSVDCKDGSTWYNYHTNDKGQILFVTNSGAANITAHNYSRNLAFQYIDQSQPEVKNIDAPIGLGTEIRIQYSSIQSQNFTSMSGTLGATGSSCYSGNWMVRCADYVNLFIGGAGGGGGWSSWHDDYAGTGGGGGGITIRNRVELNKNITYKFYVGAGGSPSTPDYPLPDIFYGTSGGSSSAFGFSASGGGGGATVDFDRVNNAYGNYFGSAGVGDYSGGNGGAFGTDGENSKWSNWGGGGGGCTMLGGNVNGGNPYGGDSNSLESGKSGTSGGGGGAGGYGYSSTSEKGGGRGGGGKLSFTFY